MPCPLASGRETSEHAALARTIGVDRAGRVMDAEGSRLRSISGTR
jgi:hypothetical protein